MKAISRIAADVFLEARRNQFFLLTFFICIFLVSLFSWLATTDDNLRGRIFLESGLSLIWFVHFCLIILFATESLFTDIEGKNIYFYLVRDVSRLQYVSGKFVGIWFSVALSVICSGVLLFLFMWFLGSSPERVPIAIFFLLLELALSVSLLIFLCFHFTRLLSIFLFLLIFFFTAALEHFLLIEGVPAFLKFFLLLLPNFKYYSYIEMIVHAQSISSVYVTFLCVYTFFFCFSFLVLSAQRFLQKDL